MPDETNGETNGDEGAAYAMGAAAALLSGVIGSLADLVGVDMVERIATDIVGNPKTWATLRAMRGESGAQAQADILAALSGMMGGIREAVELVNVPEPS